MSTILDPSFRKMGIRCQIRNQRLQKLWSTKIHEIRCVSKILCPTYWFRHFEFRKSDFKFIISDPKSFWVQSFAEIVWFPKFHVRHIGYPPFCEGYGYLTSVKRVFSCSTTIPITIGHSEDPNTLLARKKIMKKNSRFFGTFTVKTAVLCKLNRHLTHFLCVLLQVHQLMQRVLPEMRVECGLIQHVLAALLMVHTLGDHPSRFSGTCPSF